MHRSGRYGKYGELKRKANLRKSRLLRRTRRRPSAATSLPRRLKPQQTVTHEK